MLGDVLGGDFVLRGPNPFSTRASRSISLKVVVVLVVVLVVVNYSKYCTY